MTHIEALKQALETLEWIAEQRTGGMIQRKAMESITALREPPVQPAYKDSTPNLNVGESSFESWYDQYLASAPVHQENKQRLRDAYAAGMGDPLVMAAQPVPVHVHVHEMTPEMMRKVQMHSELGAHAAANLSGAYDLFQEFWRVAMSVAPQPQDENT